MNTTSSAFSPDRRIWLPLLALMAVALVADLARANLHAEARATAAAAFDASRTVEAGCRAPLEALTGGEARGFERGFGLPESSAASGRNLPASRRLPDDRRSRTADASL